MEKNTYPVLKNWSFQSDEMVENALSEVRDRLLKEFVELENFISDDGECKYSPKSKLYIQGNVFGRQKFPDDSEIRTNDIVEIEKVQPYHHTLSRHLIVTTKSGSKYDISADEMTMEQFLLFGKIYFYS